MSDDCFICSKIRESDEGRNPQFVAELRSGYVAIYDGGQYYKGYGLFLCKQCVPELHQLRPGQRDEFLREMSLVAEAVFRAFEPAKLNYELLGNTVPHLHWHLIPRYLDDPKPKVPVWENGEFLASLSAAPRFDQQQLDGLKRRLLRELEAVAAPRISNTFEKADRVGRPR